MLARPVPLLALFALAVLQGAAHAAETPIYPALHNELVSAQSGKVAKFDETPLAQTRFFAIYYSASWCPPCRAFTPDLVKWYKAAKPKNPQFELIFVSSDQTEQAMAKYMTDDEMLWPALAFNKKPKNHVLSHYCGPGIPCLVLLDAQGNVLSDSYEKGTYVGPQKVLKDIEKTLRKNPPSASTAAAASPAAPTSNLPPLAPAGNESFDQFFKKKPGQ